MDLDFRMWLRKQVGFGIKPCTRAKSGKPQEYYKVISDDVMEKEQLIKRMNSYSKHIQIERKFDQGSGMEFGCGSYYCLICVKLLFLLVIIVIFVHL